MGHPDLPYVHVPESTALGALLTAYSPHAAATMAKATRTVSKYDTAINSFAPIDVEAGKDVFPLAAVGPKQDSITQAHVGKGRFNEAEYSCSVN
jgi:hypothetical protein